MSSPKQIVNKTALLCTIALFTSGFFASPSYVHADSYDITPIPSPSPIEYKLPYPGLLPDNPLYFLKSFRDNLMEFFIGKPLDKAAFALLQSDKDVAASYLLITQEQNKVGLAETTFAEGQEYFEDAIDQTELARQQGINIDDIAKQLNEANQKHFQVLHEIQRQVPDSDKKRFQNEQLKAIVLSKKVKALQHKSLR